MTDSELVTHDDMSKTYTLLSLLVGVFVLMKLWVDGAELQVEATFKFELVNARWNTLIFQVAIQFEVQMLHARLQAEGALLQLAELLVAHSHVVKDLERNKLIPRTATQVNDIQHAVRLLQEEQSVIKLFFLNVDQGTFVQLEQHKGYFV